MARTRQNAELVETIFTPNAFGHSAWISREAIQETGLALGNNGNIRQGTPWTDKYIWEIQRSGGNPRGRPLAFRTVGISDSHIHVRPIRANIRSQLLSLTPNCLHCGTNRTLVIDHKNDIYNDIRVLNSDTQCLDDFQVLCDKCNNDFKHNAHEREKRSGRLHCARDVGLIALRNDPEYPWEKVLTEYDERIIWCKQYTYWYDVAAFWARRDWYVYGIIPLHRELKRRIQVIE